MINCNFIKQLCGNFYSRIFPILSYITISFTLINSFYSAFSNPIKSLNDSVENYQFSFYYDNAGCTSCKLLALKQNVITLSKEFPNSKINIIYDSERKSDYNSLKKQFENIEVIWDTLKVFSNTNNIASSIALIIFDKDGLQLKTYFDIQTNPIDYKAIKELQARIKLDKNKVLYTISGDILTRTNEVHFDKKGNLIAIDNSSNSFKSINIKENKISNEIHSIHELDTFYIDTNEIAIYNKLVNNASPVSKFRQFYYDNNNKLILNCNVISEIRIDSTLRFDGKDTILDISKKMFSRGVLLDYNKGKNFKLYPHPSSINLSNISNFGDNYYSTLSYFKRFSYNDIIETDTFNILLKSNDPFFQSFSPLLTYRQLIKEFDLQDFNTLTIGLYKVINSTTYYYLNPWNNIFFKHENSKIKRIQIQGFMTNLFSKNKKKGYRYTVNNLLVKNSKIYVLLQEFNNEKRCENIIVQVYNDNGFEKEYYFSNDHNIFYAGFIANSGDLTYLIYQNKDENWSIVDFFEIIK